MGAFWGQLVPWQKGRAANSLLQVDRLLVEHPSETVCEQSRSYRADAVISLLSVPIFSRAGVGSGFATYREARHAGVTITTSRFGGGSDPQRARGLNRLGFIEEVVFEQAGQPVEAAYFGFMTASPEEGLSEARHTLQNAKNSVPYIAAEGCVSATQFHSSKVRFAFPAQVTWEQRARMLREMRAQFHASSPELKDIAIRKSDWPGTFLDRIASAIRRHPARFDESYMYNGKQFRVESIKAWILRLARRSPARV